MNTYELEEYMLSDPFIRRYYGGVIAADQLPLIVHKPSIFIVNTDPISLPGEHWIVLFMSTVCEHFDSAGMKPRDEFENYLTAKGPTYMYNDKRVQSFDTETCGLFCLFYCYFRCRGYKFKEIMDMFYDNLLLNEMLVKYFYTLTV